jgi:hypothetical protein
MNSRHHDGVVYEASDSFYLRHWITKTFAGQPKRVRVSHWLCRKDDKHGSATGRPVKDLTRGFMQPINATFGPDAASLEALQALCTEFQTALPPALWRSWTTSCEKP